MGQLGFFDADKRLEALSARGDPLEAIDHLVPWESFRAEWNSPAVAMLSKRPIKLSFGRRRTSLDPENGEVYCESYLFLR